MSESVLTDNHHILHVWAMRLEGPLQDAFESMLLSTEFRADFQVDLKV